MGAIRVGRQAPASGVGHDAVHYHWCKGSPESSQTCRTVAHRLFYARTPFQCAKIKSTTTFPEKSIYYTVTSNLRGRSSFFSPQHDSHLQASCTSVACDCTVLLSPQATCAQSILPQAQCTRKYRTCVAVFKNMLCYREKEIHQKLVGKKTNKTKQTQKKTHTATVLILHAIKYGHHKGRLRTQQYRAIQPQR